MWRSALVGLYANQPSNQLTDPFICIQFFLRTFSHSPCVCDSTKWNGPSLLWLFVIFSTIFMHIRRMSGQKTPYSFTCPALEIYTFCGKTFLLWKQYTFRVCIGVKTITSQFDHQNSFQPFSSTWKRMLRFKTNDWHNKNGLCDIIAGDWIVNYKMLLLFLFSRSLSYVHVCLCINIILFEQQQKNGDERVFSFI